MYAQVQKIFNLCSTPEDAEDIDRVVDWVNGGLGTMAMVNYPYPASFVADLPANPVNASCAAAT